MFIMPTKSSMFLPITSIKAVSLMIFCPAVSLLLNYQSYGAESPATNGNFKNPDAVQRVISKKEMVANAAWWGFNATDSTDALQGAINSGASKVIVPYMGKEWIVRPIKLVGNQEIVFEPGVVVIAKEGEFKGKKDCLFSIFRMSNVTLRGYGATLRMRKEDYQSPKYTKSEWRHVILLRGSTNVNILGLRLESSGGDGIFVGETKDGSHIPSKNVLIKDCVCDDNYRQGISVCSVDTLRVENCALRNTRGTQPKSGIDLEPSNYKSMLSNIVVSNCISEDNAGAGFFCNISHLKEVSNEVSVLFVNCYARRCVASGIYVRNDKPANCPKGLIQFKNCIIEDMPHYGTHILWANVASSIQLRFSDCKWRNVAQKHKTVPVRLDMKRKKFANQTGAIEFVNCYVYDKKNRAFLKINEVGGDGGVYDVKGNINVHNSYGARMDLAGALTAPALKVKSFKVWE